MIKHLNFDWLFTASYEENAKVNRLEVFSMIDIPHTHQDIPYNYVDERDYQFKSTYQKIIPYDMLWENKHLTLCFEGVAHEATVYLNGHFVGKHQGGYTYFEYDITAYIVPLKDQLLTVYVDAAETLNMPPFGHVIDYLTYGGIYREVYLNVREPLHIEDVSITGRHLLINPVIDISVSLSQNVLGILKVDISYQSHEMMSLQFEVSDQYPLLTFQMPDLKLWDLDHPHLYQFDISFISSNHMLDTYTVVTGFREAIFKTDGFYLNQKKIKLTGLNRHQDYPYVGYAMPKSAQYHDAYLLKNELNCHMVRTSHYPQSRHFIEACDRLGLLVFEEMPGWQHIGDEDWKNIAKEHVKDMIKRDKNHPSIVLWGVRINESGDDDAFYLETNQIAKTMDPTRQTAGVRFITHSSILEDVFTLNDFIHEGHNIPLRGRHEVTDQIDIPYMVTEHTGHMFPTKSFDHEQKRLEHAKRHLRIINHMIHSDDISGAIGWCMHDYNTHIDFGSGDKICYHGVLDMFRNNKMAAYVYESQQSHTPYLEVSSNFNIGDYPKGFVDDVLVFSNCDEIHVYRYDQFIGKLEKDATYQNLLYPPFKMDWFGHLLIEKEGLSPEKASLVKAIYKDILIYGEEKLPLTTKQLITSKDDVKLALHMYGKYVANWGSKSVSYTFKGYKNGDLVIEKTRGNDYHQSFKVTQDTHELIIDDTYDVTRITIEAINENGSRLIYSNASFIIETDDLLEVIGPKHISLIGGIRSFWVKTKKITGQSYVYVKHDAFIEVLSFNIMKEVIS